MKKETSNSCTSSSGKRAVFRMHQQISMRSEPPAGSDAEAADLNSLERSLKEEGEEEEEEENEKEEDEGEEDMLYHWKRSSPVKSVSSEGLSDSGRYSLRDQKRQKLIPFSSTKSEQSVAGAPAAAEVADTKCHDPPEESNNSGVAWNFFGNLSETVLGNCSSTSSHVPAEVISGGLLSSDSPHPRHRCGVFPFIPPPCLSNTAHCNKVCHSPRFLSPATCSLEQDTKK